MSHNIRGWSTEIDDELSIEDNDMNELSIHFLKPLFNSNDIKSNNIKSNCIKSNTINNNDNIFNY